MDEFFDVMIDIKENITDNQYNIIMDSLMKVHKENIRTDKKLDIQSNKFFNLINWLDSKIEFMDSVTFRIKRKDLYDFIIINYYNNAYFPKIYFVKQALKIYFNHPLKNQDSKIYYNYVRFRE